MNRSYTVMFLIVLSAVALTTAGVLFSGCNTGATPDTTTTTFE